MLRTNKERLIKMMNMVIKDCGGDAKNFDGKEFNGKTVATYFGNQGAAIAAVAGVVKTILEGGLEDGSNNN